MKTFRSNTTFALPFFIALSALALVGCGDDDDGSPTAGSSGKGGQGGSSTGGSSGSSGSAGSSSGGGGSSNGSSGGGGSSNGSSGGGGSAGDGGSAGSGGSDTGGGGGTGGSGTGGSGTGGTGGSGGGGTGGSGTGGSGTGGSGTGGSGTGGSGGGTGGSGGGTGGSGGSGGSGTGGSGGSGGSGGTGGSGTGGSGGSGTGGSGGSGTGGSGGGGTGGGGTGGGGTGGGGTGGGGSGGTGGTGGGPVLDPTFGDGGFVHLEKISGLGSLSGLALGADDSVDVIASGDGPTTVVRLLAGGGFDDGFGKGGVAVVQPSPLWFATSFAELPGGGLMLGGIDFGGDFIRPGLARLKADGTLDASFGDGGFHIVDIDGTFDTRLQSIVQHEGRTLGVGTGGPSDFSAMALRLLPDGTLDTSFSAPDGFDFYTTDTPASFTNDVFQTSHAAADGSLYACGLGLTFPDGQTPDFNFLVARYAPNGTLDSNFGEGGVVNLDVRGLSGGFPVKDNFCTGITEAAGGKIVFVGDVMTDEFFDQANVAVVRLLADGTPDPSFGQNGVVHIDQANYDRPTGVVALPDGRVVVSGFIGEFFETSPFVLVLRADGTPDPSFGDGGFFVFDLSVEFFNSAFVARQSDGKLIVAGTSPTPFVARLNAP